jgi:hypothetical protein
MVEVDEFSSFCCSCFVTVSFADCSLGTFVTSLPPDSGALLRRIEGGGTVEAGGGLCFIWATGGGLGDSLVFVNQEVPLVSIPVAKSRWVAT